MIKIDAERCKGCELCVNACPHGLIEINNNKRNEKGFCTANCKNNEKCVSCKLCAIMCPECAITVFKED